MKIKLDSTCHINVQGPDFYEFGSEAYFMQAI